MKTEVPGSWVRLELHKFPTEVPGFRLLLKPVPAGGAVGTAYPWGLLTAPVTVLQPSLAVPSPEGTLPHRASHAPGWGNPCSAGATNCWVVGWRGWGAHRKGSGSSVQEVGLATNLMGGLVGQRCFTPADAQGRQGSVPWAHSTLCL